LSSGIPDGKGAEEIRLLLRVVLKRNSFSLFLLKAEEEMRHFPEGKQERSVG